MKRSERTALVALGAVLLITAAWWALALWPAPETTPLWLARTRSVCFGARPDGLPEAYGWLVLTGQPLAMLLILSFGWGKEVAGGLRALSRSGPGRAALASSAIVAAVALGAVGARVHGAASAFAASGSKATDGDTVVDGTSAVPTAMSLDRPPPPLELLDQRGDLIDLERFRGRTVLVTFAFGHCEAICPAMVHEVLSERRRLESRGVEAVAIVITLDPWRDTPSRLRHIADRWGMRAGEYVLSGEVDAVERTLDGWEIGRQRDLATGDIIHPRRFYIVSAAGRLSGVTAGEVAELLPLVGLEPLAERS